MDRESFKNAMVLGREAITKAEQYGDDFRTEQVHIMYDTYVHEIFHDYPYVVRTSEGFKQMVLNFMSLLTVEARVNNTLHNQTPELKKLIYGNVYDFKAAKEFRDLQRKYG